MKNVLRVAGLDPALRNFGMVKGDLSLDTGFLDNLTMELPKTTIDKQAKNVRKNSQDLLRARILFKALTAFLVDVDMVFVEMPVGSQNARAMCSYGMVVMALASVTTPLIQVTPSEVKLAATKTKTATKSQMIEWGVTNYPDAPWLTRILKGEIVHTNDNEHLADALAAIHAGVVTDEFKQALTFLK